MKKLWKQNRILFMLIIILIVCFVAICSVALTFFYSHESSVYGERLADIDKHPIKDKTIKELKEKISEFENVTKVSMNVKGRIIYVHIDFADEVSVEVGKEKTTSCLEFFDEDIIKYYDIEFVLSNSNFTIIGAKNVKIDHISWNNNNPVIEDEEDEDENQ